MFGWKSQQVIMESEAERHRRYASRQIMYVNQQEQTMSSQELDKISELLADRNSKYGDYGDNARMTQSIMAILMSGSRSEDLNEIHKEGLHMILHKMSRIVNGDPNHVDSWYD